MSWKEKERYLEKEFTFSNFVEAVRFVDKIVPMAEEINHHPDILIHSYKKVKIMLFTHSENKITNKDYSLAKKIDEIYLTPTQF
ncbi:4a-hydroxytetrahydrobiopterin dehydratase [Maribellus comscasis]|uniref:4a-hydroxytetrahydrobiopterin dehydratase n=1 Tax=Maribellus comscasis TaxID=2681766 RepID=A0A6I6JVU5_9BACT|nr:4a-hydroxytetrahydrobiopterin dehydratase [Maribellus comscasis]QGY46711.1 4a-hydroxytetrahydrobiopterin dehydratase [Maribellus comscasis]